MLRTGQFGRDAAFSGEHEALRLTDLADGVLDALRSAGAYLSDLATPSIRLGVTGLARSGKTVFITALIRNLTAGGRLPFFDAHAEGRILRAYLQPQPDDDVPRFDYEAHLAALMGEPPRWPESTRRISELRVTVEYRAEGMLKRAMAPGRLHVDVVDYPGEWLLDLALLDQSYEDWSREAISLATEPARGAASAEWLQHLAGLDPGAPQDERTALEAARVFTAFLAGARRAEPALSTLGPGRFLLPGDLAGSPLLTFVPLAMPAGWTPPRNSLAAMMARRFESYKAHVVKPFFRDHFSRLDRQIVLVDVLAALNAGAAAVEDLSRALEASLRAFRPGARSWLATVLPRRIDRVLFAASKADHLPAASHDRLEAVLRLMTEQAAARATFAGAAVGVIALAALRATREVEAQQGGERLACIRGVPIAGEQVGGKLFDGSTEVALFPGDLPADPRQALAPAGHELARRVRFVRFRPPRLARGRGASDPEAWPHVRLDRALQFLIGDRLQ
ncbi:MAG: YcjX family protein [Hyphomicrobiaceae bacterium]|nr:YcjX family protein [Hyphomicrobiaceae bacterium]